MGVAIVQDGRNWARIEADHHTHALFDRGEDGDWDALFAAGPQVVAAGPKDMLMFYHSFDAAACEYAIGLATSEDGFRCACLALTTSLLCGLSNGLAQCPVRFELSSACGGCPGHCSAVQQRLGCADGIVPVTRTVGRAILPRNSCSVGGTIVNHHVGVGCSNRTQLYWLPCPSTWHGVLVATLSPRYPRRGRYSEGRRNRQSVLVAATLHYGAQHVNAHAIMMHHR